MSRKSNVNPDHYKQAGRGRQGQDVVHEIERQKFKEQTGSRSPGSSDPQRSRKKANASRTQKKAPKKK